MGIILVAPYAGSSSAEPSEMDCSLGGSNALRTGLIAQETRNVLLSQHGIDASVVVNDINRDCGDLNRDVSQVLLTRLTMRRISS